MSLIFEYIIYVHMYLIFFFINYYSLKVKNNCSLAIEFAFTIENWKIKRFIKDWKASALKGLNVQIFDRVAYLVFRSTIHKLAKHLQQPIHSPKRVCWNKQMHGNSAMCSDQSWPTDGIWRISCSDKSKLTQPFLCVIPL